MTSAVEAAAAVFKPLRPDDRREATHSAFQVIVLAEYAARIQQTRRLKEARAAAANTGRLAATGWPSETRSQSATALSAQYNRSSGTMILRCCF